MFDVTQRGNTTTVKTDNFTFKITFSTRYRRYQVKRNNQLQSEGSFQDCLNYCQKREVAYTGYFPDTVA